MGGGGGVKRNFLHHFPSLNITVTKLSERLNWVNSGDNDEANNCKEPEVPDQL